MSGYSDIEWTDKTWNPIRARLTEKGRKHFGVTKAPKVGHFCIHVSEGCRNCYAEKRQPYFGHGAKDSYRQSYLDQGLIEVYLDEKELLAPLKWRKPCRVFVCSMTDLYGEWVPDGWIDRIKAVEALCPHIVFQELTKRSKRMREYMSSRDPENLAWIANFQIMKRDHMGNRVPWPLPNLHMGVSVEDQQRAEERIPDLLATPAAVRFISAEPLLGAVELTRIPWRQGGFLNAFTLDYHDGAGSVIAGPPSGWGPIDWVILGGESGPHARPLHPDWARKVRDDCKAAGVPFFFKQWGEYMVTGPMYRGCRPVPSGVGMEERAYMARVGKKRAGRLLDGVEHNELPGVRG